MRPIIVLSNHAFTHILQKAMLVPVLLVLSRIMRKIVCRLRLIGYSIRRHIRATATWNSYPGYPRRAHPNRER